MKHVHDWTVTTDGSDSSGRMTLPYLCRLLQETATMHAEKLGWGYEALEKQGLQWVLSRQWIRMHRYPRWKDDVRITTWPSDKGAITWYRDFRISDSRGEELGMATSLWFVMDRESRRPRPAKVGPDMPTEGAERVRTEDLKPLPPLVAPEAGGRISAGFHDIDVHDHVNNVRYLTWMLDGLDANFLRRNTAGELEINFLAEGFIGDEMEVRTEGTGTSRLQSLVRLSDEVEMCRMRSEWEPAEN